MEKLKVLMHNDRDGALFITDALRVEGVLWLVPRWIENPAERWREPIRAIRVPEHHVQPAPDGFPCDLMVVRPVPIALLEGRPSEAPQADGFEALEAPGFRIPLGSLGLQ